MKCEICTNTIEDIKNGCVVCGYKPFFAKKSFISRLFKKEEEEELAQSKEITKMNHFLIWFFSLQNSSAYISRKMVDSRIGDEASNVTFFKKIKQSNDLQQYCNQYQYSYHNVDRYLDINDKFYDYLKTINEEFIKKKLSEDKDYLDHILKSSDPDLVLDEEQRRAVIVDEDYSLIVAGAGSGKTTTMAAKVKYLVDKKGILPEEILVISYTNRAVNELKERITKHLGLNCMIATFHSVGRAIILKDENTSSSLVENDNFFFINKYLNELVMNDSELINKLVLLFGYYLDIPEEIVKNKTKQGKDGLLSDYHLFGSLKNDFNEVAEETINCFTKNKITLRNEYLRSMQEVQIANFLYLNKINYCYEIPYKHKIPNAKKIYTPDFFIRQGNKECYIEHFDISETLENKRYSKNELGIYISNMKDKINHHKKFGTDVIVIYSLYRDGQSLLFHLEKELLARGFKLEKRSSEEVYKKILTVDKSKYLMKLSVLVSRFMHNFKTKGLEYSDFVLLKAKTNNPRNLLFFDILEKVYLHYQNYLKDKNAVDFDDMINESARLLDEVETMKEKLKFRYIIVDEYQDISRQRFNLLSKLAHVCEAKIVAVGDDWQSIFAFAGSEIKLFNLFIKDMGYGCELKITNTYRNSQELIDIAGGFIQKNNFQIKKALKSAKHITNPIVVFTYSDDVEKNKIKGIKGINYEKAKLLNQIIEKIIQVDGYESKILLIGRYSFDEHYLCETEFFHYSNQGRITCTAFAKAELTFMTAHSAKGLTYDNVVILNAQHSTFGFPAQIEDDPILKFVVSTDYTIEHSEERRLFYVAMTRAKNRVFILAPVNKPSQFVIELLRDYEQVTCHGEIASKVEDMKKGYKKCPVCGYPLLQHFHKSYGQKLFICTNEPEVCDYMSNSNQKPAAIQCCEACDGFMIVKKAKSKGRNNYFLGCTNYRDDGKGCNNAKRINDKK